LTFTGKLGLIFPISTLGFSVTIVGLSGDMTMTDSLTYADAGVDIDKANRLVIRIKTIAKSDCASRCHGGYRGIWRPVFTQCQPQMEQPVLVSSTDGVGTKLKIAFLTGRHDTVGIDLVAMCVNDILVQGAKPCFFWIIWLLGRAG
jgi:phosphoribosylformylglycinamidine cyclo-ligase